MSSERDPEHRTDDSGNLPFEYRPDLGAASNFFRMLNSPRLLLVGGSLLGGEGLPEGFDTASECRHRLEPAPALPEGSYRFCTAVHRRLTRHEDADLSAWLLQAGDYEQARRDSSYLLFLAAAGLVAGRAGPHSGYQHIVVDEAQDIRPVEWWMLSRTFRAGAEERWSVFGDMNQRRSDFTWTSWARLADLLQLSEADSDQLPEPEGLRSGYRSTHEILSYAGALLPRGERANHALRNGPEPSVRRVGPKQVASVATEAAERLTIRYHQGSVAVISYRQKTVDEIEKSLTKRRWRKGVEGDGSLRRDRRGCRLSVVRPVDARGLEFDAVVVVEPADFKPNLGRHGELYTSLTRANQELVVVHSKAMPKPISGRGNRVSG